MEPKNFQACSRSGHVVHLVVPVHNRIEEVDTLLQSLETLNLGNLELLVTIIDDESTPPVSSATKWSLKKFSLTIIRQEKGRGPAVARNLAINRTQSDFIWFLDSDTEIIAPDCLMHMVEILLRNPQTVGVGGVWETVGEERLIQKLEILPNFIFLNRCISATEFRPVQVDAIATSNLLLRSKDFEETNGFMETLPRDEDNDLCLMLKENGYHFYQDENTLVLHHCSPLGRQSGAFAHFSDPKAYLKDLLETRIVLLGRHAPWKLMILPLLDLCLAPLIFLRIVRGTYSGNRIQMATQGSKIRQLPFTFCQSLACYFSGFRMCMRGRKQTTRGTSRL